MLVKKVKEGSAVTVTARFRNDGEVVVPLTVRYRVDCQTTRRVIVNWTDVSPASTVSVTIPASLNVMVNQSNASERRVVVFEANHGTDGAFTNSRAYDVMNLQGVT